LGSPSPRHFQHCALPTCIQLPHLHFFQRLEPLWSLLWDAFVPPLVALPLVILTSLFTGLFTYTIIPSKEESYSYFHKGAALSSYPRKNSAWTTARGENGLSRVGSVRLFFLPARRLAASSAHSSFSAFRPRCSGFQGLGEQRMEFLAAC